MSEERCSCLPAGRDEGRRRVRACDRRCKSSTHVASEANTKEVNKNRPTADAVAARLVEALR